MPADGTVRERLAAARAARRRVDLEAHARAIDELEASIARLAPNDGKTVYEWAAKAERLRDVGYVAEEDDDLRRAAETATRGLAAVDGHYPDIAARLHLALGQVHARLHGTRWEEQATEHYLSAARRFIESDERDDAAATLAALAWTVQLSATTLRAARESLDEALSLAEDAAMRASMLSQRAQVQVWLGDVDAAQSDIEAAWPLAQEGDDRSLAYVAWAAAMIASLRGQRAVVESWVEQGDRRRGSWAEDNVTGLWYEATVIDALARAGAEQAARERLDQLLPQLEREPTAVGLAQVSFKARCGDPDAAADAWEQLRDRPDLEPWDAARLRLLLAAARARSGADVGRDAAEAFELCAGLDEPAVLLTLEPTIARELLPAAAAAGSALASRLLATHLSWDIQVLGAFSVTSPAGERVELTGRPRQLIMQLAVVGEPVSRVRVARWLWPDADDAAWRRKRLRPLLHRVRSQVPGVVEALSGDRVGFGEHVTVDLQELIRVAVRARAAQDPVVRVARAREALGHFSGDLLPDEVVDDERLEPARTKLVRDATWLHTVVAEHAAEEGHGDLALLHARHALEAEPTNEAAAVLAADLLRRRGRRVRAREILRAAESALAELGLDASRRLRAAVARLERTED